jgi:hypothetical protein
LQQKLCGQTCSNAITDLNDLQKQELLNDPSLKLALKTHPPTPDCIDCAWFFSIQCPNSLVVRSAVFRCAVCFGAKQRAVPKAYNSHRRPQLLRRNPCADANEQVGWGV